MIELLSPRINLSQPNQTSIKTPTMENQSPEFTDDEASLHAHPQIHSINTFCEITACASKAEALFFLESHDFDLDAAVSTFLDDANPVAAQPQPHYSPSESLSPSPSPSPSRSRSPSPPPASRSYNLRSAPKPSAAGVSTSAGHTRRGGISNPKHEDDPDEVNNYTGGEKSGMIVQDPSKANDVDEIFNQARRAGAVEASADHGTPYSSFAGTGRLLSGEASSVPQPPEVVNHSITFWRNGFTVDDGPLRRLDDPQNASFLESIRNSECPTELAPDDKRTAIHVNLTRKEEDYKQPERRQVPFRGVGRTLGSTSGTTPVESNSVTTVLTTAPAPSMGLIVDQDKPCTSIQLRLADGTRMVSQFNHHHTVRDIRGFIDASRPAGPMTYQLQTVGFPPKPLTDLRQTIEEVGIANSVVIQKL